MNAIVGFSRATGKSYKLNSFNIERRKKSPESCFECGETMYGLETDKVGKYTVMVYECRNGHSRTMFREGCK